MFLNRKKYVAGSMLCLWSILGFKRGMDSYDYYHPKDIETLPSIYTHKICKGISYIFVYINPLLLFLVIPKEIYRL